MGWLAHLVGGPLHGEVEYNIGYWPLLAKRMARDCAMYRLVCWVEAHGAVVPETPLVYVWEELDDAEAADAVQTYVLRHSSSSGVLAGHQLSWKRAEGKALSDSAEA